MQRNVLDRRHWQLGRAVEPDGPVPDEAGSMAVVAAAILVISLRAPRPSAVTLQQNLN